MSFALTREQEIFLGGVGIVEKLLFDTVKYRQTFVSHSTISTKFSFASLESGKSLEETLFKADSSLIFGGGSGI